ncbi:surfeit locus protein 6-like [Zingiber officinale]|uniref:Surfeit locus protein 6 n=1 Tax=Zingiber officinale TaxID=94328 RepID=A0A8J5HEF2_ZINOF|nr:surfeit locus protein 6-like [Zingiber officinale]KAG6522416.1 hypothetical protein ZIOFF_019556 [Zingiber officinale]
MAKKDGRASSTTARDTNVDLKALIDTHSLFFDRLVELIPARYYLPLNEDKPWFHGLSKIQKAAVKAESRENIKKSRRARFDPAKSTTTTLDHLKKSIDAANAAAETSEGEEDEESGESENDVENPRPSIFEGPSLTYEELRKRLHNRIDELRSGRNTRPQLLIQQRPDKVEKRSKNRKKDEKENDSASDRKKEEATESSKGNTKRKMANRDGGACAPDISFGKINVGGEDNDRRKKRKLSKKHQLENAKKLVQAKKDPEKGAVVSKKHSWKAAVSRAAGVKVHDDPKLLKESMKKDKKRQQKHAESWKERIKIMEKSKAEKQKTRAANIKERIHQKRTRRIEKREKKLMRPGFEGRKEGYINR